MSSPDSSPKALHIVELRSENVKRLRAVTIRPDGRIVSIGGDNDQGKSSVLQSIEMAIGGGDRIIEEPIRRGAKKARTVVDLGDLIVTRTFTKSGSTLVVTGKDGTPQKSPQELLNRLASAVTFDPFSFTSIKPPAQKAVLQGIVKLDFSAIDAAKLKAFNERTNVNRDLQQQQALVARLPHHQGVPAEESTSADILAQIDEANAWNRAIDNAEAAVATAEQTHAMAVQVSNRQETTCASLLQAYDAAVSAADSAQSEADAAKTAIPAEPKIDVGPLESQLAEIMAKIKAAHAHNQAVDAATNKANDKAGAAVRAKTAVGAAKMSHDTAKEQLDECVAKVRAAGDSIASARTAATVNPRRNVASLRESLSAIEQTNAKVRANKQRAEAEAAVRAKQTQSDALTRKIDEAEEQKQALLAAAKFPVPGLSFGEDGVLMDGLPFDQAGDAEQIRVSIAIAAALNPTIRVMLIRDGSLIGTRKMELIRQLAEEYNLQVWIEVVSDKDDKKSSVVIEDGHVVGQETAPDEPTAPESDEMAPPAAQPELFIPPSR